VTSGVSLEIRNMLRGEAATHPIKGKARDLPSFRCLVACLELGLHASMLIS
jgi:hypothetical protein